MSTVVDLEERRLAKTPHLQGLVRCLTCGHENQAVAPVGTMWLECPACHLLKQTWYFPVEQGRLEWRCACGCTVFGISEKMIFCKYCGKQQEF